MTSGVYRIRNLINQKCYFGSAGERGVERRLNEHRRMLERGKHYSRHLQNAWDKYGSNQFAFELVEECGFEQCLEREQYYLDTVLFANCDDDRFHRLGYNLSRSAQACMRGRKHSRSTKLKISRAMKGNTNNPGHKGKNHQFYGKTHSKAAIAKNRQKHAKLTAQTILQIKAMLSWSNITQDAIAQQFGIHQSTVSLIKNRKLWPDAGIPSGCYIYGEASPQGVVK